MAAEEQVVSESVFLSQCLTLSRLLCFGHRVAQCASRTKGDFTFGGGFSQMFRILCSHIFVTHGGALIDFL